MFIDLQNVRSALQELNGRYHAAYIFHDESQMWTIEQEKGRIQWRFDRSPKYIAFSLGNKGDQFADELIYSTVLWANSQFSPDYEFVIVSNDRGFSEFVSRESQRLGGRKVLCSGVLPEKWGPSGPPEGVFKPGQGSRRTAPKHPRPDSGQPSKHKPISHLPIVPEPVPVKPRIIRTLERVDQVSKDVSIGSRIVSDIGTLARVTAGVGLAGRIVAGAGTLGTVAFGVSTIVGGIMALHSVLKSDKTV